MALLRVVRHTLSLFLAAFFALPLVSIFARADISWGHKGLVACLWLVAAAKPPYATLAFAATLPLGMLWTSMFSGLTSTSVAEILTLALHRARRFV